MSVNLNDSLITQENAQNIAESAVLPVESQPRQELPAYNAVAARATASEEKYPTQTSKGHSTDVSNATAVVGSGFEMTVKNIKKSLTWAWAQSQAQANASNDF
jgi:hypothetical protein